MRGTGADALALNGKDAGGLVGSSATRWEPGSARAPTFCAEPVPPGKASGDGDLPLAGDDRGDPKRESSSPPMSEPVVATGSGTSGIALSERLLWLSDSEDGTTEAAVPLVSAIDR